MHTCEDFECLDKLWDDSITDSQCVKALDLSMLKPFVLTKEDWDCWYSNIELNIMVKEIEDSVKENENLWHSQYSDTELHTLTNEVKDCVYVSEACFDLGYKWSDNSFEEQVEKKFPKPVPSVPPGIPTSYAATKSVLRPVVINPPRTAVPP